MEPGPHVEEMEAAIRADGEGLRALLDGDDERARERLGEAVARYRASWELAPPRSYGRLVGMLKAAVIAGDAAEAAAYAREQVGEADSPPSSYVLAIAALVEGDDAAAPAPPRACAPARPRSAAPPTRSRRWRAATPTPTPRRSARSSRTSRAARSTSPACPSPTPR